MASTRWPRKPARLQPGSPPPLLLISFDGFRADYLQRFPMPNLELLYSQGVLVEQLTNVFVTKTFPNHFTMVTGLYAESHGIVASNMYDPVSHKTFRTSTRDPMWWNKAQPLWISAQDSGYKTAAMMWPGSDITYGNRTATHFLRYKPWRDLSAATGECDELDAGERGGRDVHVDDNVGHVMSELKRLGLWGRVNLLVTSDHGMAQCAADRLIRLDDCLHPDNYTLVDVTPVAAIIPLADPQVVFALLDKCHAHMTAYLKQEIPDRLHYRNSERIPEIILVADEGWTIVRQGDQLPRLGDHGYDNTLPSMHPFFSAVGPSFRQGYRMSRLQSVDIYPLMCHLLSVPPQPNNGTLAQARCLLSAETCWDVPRTIGLVVCVLLVLTTVTVLFKWLSQHRFSGPWPLPIHNLDCKDDDDDDVDSLLE
ncbi:unnamed protein product [Lampetra planeri]